MGNKAEAHWGFTHLAAWDKNKNARHFANIFCLNSHIRFLFSVKHTKKNMVTFLEWNFKDVNSKKLRRKAVQTCYLL